MAEYQGLHQERRNKKTEARLLKELGDFFSSISKRRKAIEYHEQSLNISREIGDRLGEGASLDSLGNAYDSLGEKEKACGLWKEAVAIFEAIESPFAKNFRQLIEENCD